MKAYKIGFENGDSFITGFNGSLTEANDYYMGKTFNLGTVSDNLQRCISVEAVEDTSNG